MYAFNGSMNPKTLHNFDSGVDLASLSEKIPAVHSLSGVLRARLLASSLYASVSNIRVATVNAKSAGSTVGSAQRYLASAVPVIFVWVAVNLKKSRIPGLTIVMGNRLRNLYRWLDSRYDLHSYMVSIAANLATISLWFALLLWSSAWQAIIAYQQAPSFEQVSKTAPRSKSPVARLNSFFRLSRSQKPLCSLDSTVRTLRGPVTLHLGCDSVVKTSGETLCKDPKSILSLLVFLPHELDGPSLELLADAGIFPYTADKRQAPGAEWFIDKDPKIFKAILCSLRLYKPAKSVQTKAAIEHLLESFTRSELSLLKCELLLLNLTALDSVLIPSLQSL